MCLLINILMYDISSQYCPTLYTVMFKKKKKKLFPFGNSYDAYYFCGNMILLNLKNIYFLKNSIFETDISKFFI